MSDCLEVLFVSDSSEKQKSANCFNPNVGTTLMAYKGNGAPKNCISVIGNDYLITGDSSKPILSVWPLNSQESSQELRMVIAGKPSALCVSPNGHYCVSGISTKIYVWQISSGALLNVISKHYQDISKIIFTDDSSHFVTIGEDGLVLMWKLADVVAKQFGNIFRINTYQVQPLYNFSNHSLPVTDAFIGCGNMKARLFTVSSDQTCKIYSLSDGQLLLSIVFEYILTAVTVNELETELFVGTNCGKIQIFNLDSYPRSLEHYVSDDINTSGTLNGHTKAVTCLSTSFDGVTLASGSDDEKVYLWNVPSRQLIRSFEMKGPVTNLFYYFASGNIFSNKFKPNLVVSKFEKTSKVNEENVDVSIWVEKSIKPLSLTNEFGDGEKDVVASIASTKNSEDMASVKDQIIRLKEINKQLYGFAMKKILQNPTSIGIGKSSNGNGINYENEEESE